jgi:multidrug transporter EmrE-like cation transporter
VRPEEREERGREERFHREHGGESSPDPLYARTTFAVYLITYAVLSTTGLILLRRSLADVSTGDTLSDPLFYAGALSYALSFGTFLLSLRRYEVLTVFPVFLSVTYAGIAVAAAVFLGESLTPVRVAGLVLVGAGLILLAR